MNEIIEKKIPYIVQDIEKTKIGVICKKYNIDIMCTTQKYF